jgi:hypothetical protein
LFDSNKWKTDINLFCDLAGAAREFFLSMRTEVIRVVGRECGRLGLAGLSKKEGESDSSSRITICVIKSLRCGTFAYAAYGL